MAFGLQFTNNSGTVTLDSEYARLSVICAGAYAPNADGGLGASVTFPTVITSQEPPLVFIRPTTVSGLGSTCLASVSGSPGAWTGFYIRAFSKSTAQPSGKYFAAAFQANPTAAYGLRIWDGASRILFDSGTSAAVFSRAFQNWSFVRYEYVNPNYTNYYSVSYDFPENEYLMINNFGMNMVAGSSYGRMLYTLWDFPNKILYAVTTSSSNPTAFYLPALFAKLNV
jgi:hypothetical protein